MSYSGCAIGYFEVTGEAARFCRAGFLARIGQRTPATVCFSTPREGWGPRGFSVRLRTEQGEHAIEGTNLPVAATPSGETPPPRFPPTIEAAHRLALAMSDRGTPRSWRHMHGYALRRVLWINGDGELFFARYHFKTEQGIESWPMPTGAAVQRADLAAALAQGERPSWRFDVQVMPHADAARCGFDPFDLTMVWPHADYPPRSLGRLVLEHEVPVIGHSPSGARVLPGIGPAPSGTGRHRQAGDACIQVRRFWRGVLTDGGRERLVANLAYAHPAGARYWAIVDPELGARVAIAVHARARVS
jgi:catalase